jgi:hypothetical protein
MQSLTADGPTSTESDIVWGADAIGVLIDRTPRQTHYLLNKGLIKSAKRVGRQWVASRSALRREFGGE